MLVALKRAVLSSSNLGKKIYFFAFLAAGFGAFLAGAFFAGAFLAGFLAIFTGFFAAGFLAFPLGLGAF